MFFVLFLLCHMLHFSKKKNQSGSLIIVSFSSTWTCRWRLKILVVTVWPGCLLRQHEQGSSMCFLTLDCIFYEVKRLVQFSLAVNSKLTFFAFLFWEAFFVNQFLQLKRMFHRYTCGSRQISARYLLHNLFLLDLHYMSLKTYMTQFKINILEHILRPIIHGEIIL